MVAEVFLRGFSEEQQNQCQEKNPATFQEIQNVKYCLMLAFKSMLERTPEQQSPPARPGPHPAKADQCQHRCFNVHNIYKPDSFRQFIQNFKKTNIVQQEKKTTDEKLSLL